MSAYNRALYNEPFKVRSPDYTQVKYEFTFATPAGAKAAFDALRNKKYTLLESGGYVLPVGHRMKSRGEALSGEKVTFVGQIKSSLLPSSPDVQAMELELAGAEGTLTVKEILA